MPKAQAMFEPAKWLFGPPAPVAQGARHGGRESDGADDDVCAVEAVEGATAIAGHRRFGAPVEQELAERERDVAQFQPESDVQSDLIRLVALSAVRYDTYSDLL